MDEVYELLEKLDIKYVRHNHPAVFTCDEADKYWVRTDSAHTKNLFLRTQKAPYKYFLYILECHQRADLKKLYLSHLTFASPEDLRGIMGLTPGSVSPFGLINDKKHQVTVLIDQLLSDNYNSLMFHPNINTSTFEISWSNFKKYLSYSGHTYRLVPE